MTTTAMVSVITAVLVGCVSIVIHIAVCAYYIKHKKKHTTHNVNTEAVYQEVSDQKKENEAIETKQNQAYSSFLTQQ